MSRVCSVSSQAACLEASGAGAVGGEQGDGHVVGLADVCEVGGEVGEVGAVVLEEAEVLAGAGEGRPP